MKTIRFLGHLMLLVFIMIIFASCSEDKGTKNSAPSSQVTQSQQKQETKKEEEKIDFKKGEEIKFKDGSSLTVTEIERSSGSQFDKPKGDNEFVIVHVKIVNNGKDKISYNPFNYKLKNSNGQIVDETFTTIDEDTNLNSGELAPGGNVSGSIPFEAPRGDKGLKLIYNPNIFSSKEIIIDLQ